MSDRPNPVPDQPDAARLLDAAAREAPSAAAEAELEALRRAFPELEVERRIGEGGMATVYRARQTRLGRTVALKVLKRDLAAREELETRFEREARALASLDHPRILRVLEFGERDGRFFLLTDYVDGVDLRRLMELGQLSPEEALRIVPQICEALRYAHMHGVVHRDVKPENILVDVDGNVRIADFGLARIVRGGQPPETLTRATQVIGTPHYMAPEQWRGGPVDHRADIFSLGVVLYEMLTGTLPIGEFSPPSQHAGVPPRLDDVVRRALAQDPERRFQQVDELETALRDGSAAPPPAPSRRAARNSMSLVTIACIGVAYGTAFEWIWLTTPAALWILAGAAAVLLTASVVAAWALHRLQAAGDQGFARRLAAFAAWYGPVSLFVGGVIGFLWMVPDVRARPWILVLVGGVIVPIAACFLWWQTRRAARVGR